jgi:ribonuclease HIII
MNSYTSAITHSQAEKLQNYLQENDFEFIKKDYTIYSAKKTKLNVSVYEKGPKILVQGKDTKEFIEFVLEPIIFDQAKIGYEEINEPEMFTPHFGIDESGKGDYFGPLVISGVYTNSEITRYLMNAGVMDSKKINSAEKIRKLAAVIRETPGIFHHTISISPTRYNELYEEFRNLNQLLAWGHATVIEKLHEIVPDCPRTLSDQFAKPAVLELALSKKKISIKLEQRTKGESDIAVAAASIIARERFVDWIDKTSKAGGVTLPLGASNSVILAANQLMKIHGKKSLEKVAKLHFRTTSMIHNVDNE